MITLEELPLVAIISMNDTHLEETLIINRLENSAEAANIEEIKTILKELLAHTEVHFENEEKMMQETEFPAYYPHKGEHDRHLNELRSLINYFDKNQDPQAILAYIKGSLTPWMKHHIQTMDTVTAEHIQQVSK